MKNWGEELLLLSTFNSKEHAKESEQKQVGLKYSQLKQPKQKAPNIFLKTFIPFFHQRQTKSFFHLPHKEGRK